MSQRGNVPCGPARAVDRAMRFVKRGGQYVFGTGNVHAEAVAGSSLDVPWTAKEVDDGHGGKKTVVGVDCAGLVCFSYELTRHRPGFNARRNATIVDDINVDSLLEDAEPVLGRGELTERIELPELGALVAYPSVRITNDEGETRRIPGHVGIIVGVFGGITLPGLADEWDPMHPDYRRLKVAHACGPNFRKPGIVVTDGTTWMRHDELWPKPQHKTRILRVRMLEAV